jgi:hypothetical protein
MHADDEDGCALAMNNIDSSSVFGDPDLQFAMDAASSIGRYPLTKITAGSLGDQIIIAGPSPAIRKLNLVDGGAAAESADPVLPLPAGASMALSMDPNAIAQQAPADEQEDGEEEGPLQVQLTNTSFIDAHSPAVSMHLGTRSGRVATGSS